MTESPDTKTRWRTACALAVVLIAVTAPTLSLAQHDHNGGRGFSIDQNEVCIWSTNSEVPMHIAVLGASGETVDEVVRDVPGDPDGDGFAEDVCWSHHFAPGRWTVEVSQAETPELPAYLESDQLVRRASSEFSLGGTSFSGKRIKVNLHARGALVGEKVKVSIERFYYGCTLTPFLGQAVRTCSFVPAKPRFTRRELTVRPNQKITVGRTRHGEYQALLVKVRAPRFEKHGVPYKASSAKTKLRVGARYKRAIKRDFA